MSHPRENASCMNGASLLMLIALAVVVSAITVLGCAWPGTSHSVRFNAYQNEREMGRLPPLPTMANGLNELRATWDEEYDAVDYDDYSNSPDHSKEVDDLWERAETAEEDGDFSLDRELLNEYLKTAEAPARRNSAVDRLDVLTAIEQGSNPSAVTTYLDARRLHDAGSPDKSEIDRLLQTIQADRNLKDNIAYLRAAEQHQQKDYLA